MNEVTSIKNARYETDEGRAYLSVEINGKEARIFWEQKLYRFGAVNLGRQFFNDFVFILAEDPADGRAGMKCEGFTNDVRVLRLYERMMQDIEEGRFAVGPVKI